MTIRKFVTVAIVATAVAAVGACKPRHSGGGTPPPKVPSINTTIKTNHKGDRIRVFSTANRSQKQGKVRVCLANSSSGRDKGLHFKKAGKPKYVTKKKNQQSCGHYSPGKKTFYLWRRTPVGKWKLRRTVKLNLTRFAGQQVTFDWIRDPAI